MKITKNEILSQCSQAVYQRGVILNQKECLYDVDLSEERNLSGVDYISGMVEGSGTEDYFVDVSIDSNAKTNKIRGASCDCLAYNQYPGICKHIVSMLLYYNELVDDNDSKKERNAPAETSHDLKKIIDSYLFKEKSQFCMEYNDGEVELELTFHLEAERETIELRIGKKQKYVVKDIFKLADDIKNVRSVSYGKNLEFVHRQSAFSKESLPIVNFIIDATDGKEKEHYNSIYMWGSTSQARKSLTLDALHLDRLMELYEDKEILVDLHQGNDKTKVHIKRENPRLPVYILGIKNKQKESMLGEIESAQITMENILLLMGRKQCYIMYHGVIHICGLEYYHQYESFLNIMSENIERARKSYFPLQIMQPTLELASADFATFSSKILPVLQSGMDVKVKDIDFNDYRPVEAVIQIHLDLVKGNAVTCKVEEIYGEEVVNLITETSDMQSNRDYEKEYKTRYQVEKYFNQIDKKNKLYYLQDEDSLLLLLEEGVEELNKIGQVYVSEAFKKVRIVTTPSVSTGVSVSGGLLSFSFDVQGIERKEMENILSDYKKRKKYHRLKSGEFIKLQDNGLEMLLEISEGLHLKDADFKEGNVILPMYRALYLDSVIRENANKAKAERDGEFRTLIREMKSTEDSEFMVPKEVKAELRPYQENGYQWLRTLGKYGFGGILADDMGLGKTLQVITLLTASKEGTSIVVCPASLVYNWDSECTKFSPRLRVCTVIGSAEQRKRMIQESNQYDLLITSYDLLKRDIEYYQELQFNYHIIDEAQYIKNSNTQAAEAVKAIKSRCRFALTGTPIENRLSELWSIFDFLMPGYMYSYNRFKNEFEKAIVESQDNVATLRLQRMIKPFILRRLKKEVLKELPDKLEEIVYAKLEEEQEKLYKANEKKIIEQLANKSESDYNQDKLQVLAAITQLRQICCDPSLCYENYESGSAKLDTCVEIVDNAVSAGHKLLIFSQFATMLERIQGSLEQKGMRTLLLTGKTSKEKRKEMVNEFQEGKKDVFLISLKAGGTGLNLTAADIVIHYDPWWNIAAQNQATDRAHRIGQENTVTVMKLIAKDTIEERILKLQDTKKELADQIISAEGISLSAMSKEELLQVLEG
ncbi:SNF2 helicase associated domain-containing protein [Anaeromicropila herbilytica]|uniref:DEAD/DEAH box helicase n=1 Tax=Anaeromicropila herbilytica TaxID=2785025 RepID=A0A7R7IEA4_9FIRM|nr:SNF2 helicase associated domain-containing protein [Anaeromicropila herbilytica]BCN32508.1 DEAD/DEAH box helicase [Anaeromicropila herbilytica]